MPQITLALSEHHKEQARADGVPNPPSSVTVSTHDLEEALDAWMRGRPDAAPDEIHAHALATLVWRQLSGDVVAERKFAAAEGRSSSPAVPVAKIDRGAVLTWAWRIAVLLLLGFMAVRAHAQIDVIQIQHNDNSLAKNYAGPFKIKEGTNLTFSIGSCPGTDCNKLIINASSTASTAWSALTSGTNSNVGTFAMSANTLDLTAATLVKLRVAGGLTTSANGDIGQNSTGGIWHFFAVGADRLIPANTNTGNSGQVPISNGDGTFTVADPIVSGPTAVGGTPSTNPVQVGCVFLTTPATLTNNQVGELQCDNGQNLLVKVINTVTVSGTVTTTPPSNASTNVTQWAGTAVDTNSGVKSAGTLRVVLATDQPQLTNALKVDGSAVIQPVSGTITANIGTSGSLALDASVTGLEVSQASTTSGQKGALVQGAVTTAAPTYTTAQTSPLSLTTAGALRTDSSAVTQPVSGTVTTTPPANASTNIAQVNGSTVSTAATGVQKVGITGNTGAAMDAAGQNASSPANELLIGGQFNTTPTTITSGNMSPFQLDNAGNLKVNVAVGGGTGGTSSNFAAAFPSAGTAIGVKNGANMVNLTADGSSNLNVNCTVGCSAAGDQSTGSTALGAANAVIAVLLTGDNKATFQLQSAGTGVYTVTPQCSFDNGTLYNVNGYIQDPISGALSLTATVASAQATTDYPVLCPQGASHAQMKVTSYTSGTANWLARATINSGPALAFGSISTSAPSLTTGQVGPISIDTTGNVRTANAALQLAQGSTTSGQTGPLAQGAVTTSAPTYTTGQTSPLSLDTGGNLRVVNNVGDTVGSSSSLAALNNAASVTLTGLQGAGVLFSSAASATFTVVPELSWDNGTTWTGSYFYNPATGAAAASLVNPTNGQYAIIGANGASNARVRVSSFTSGSISAQLRASMVMEPAVNIALLGGNVVGSTLPVSGTVTANAGSGNFATNLAQVNGNTVSTSATGVQKVGVTGNAGAAVDAAGQNVASPANEFLIGAQFNTSPTTITTGNMSPLQVTAAANLKTDISTIAGTAPSTAGKIDVKAADGDAFVRQATAANLNAQVVGNAASGASDAGNPVKAGGVFNTTQPTVTTGQRVDLQATARGELMIAKGVSGLSIDNTGFNVNNTPTVVQGNKGSNAQAWWTEIGDATNGPAAVKAASTAAAATDPALVVAVSPNNTVAVTQSGAWSLTANQSVNVAQVGGTNTVTGGVAGSMGVGGLAASGASKAGNPVQMGGVFNTTQPTVTTGQAVEAQMSARGAEIVATGVDVFHVTCDSGCTPGGSTADASAFTFGTTALNPMGAVVDDTSPNAVTENSIGTPRMSGTRVLYGNLRDNSGAYEVGIKNTDAAASDIGLVVRDPVLVQLLNAWGKVSPRNSARILGTFNRPVTSTGDAIDVNVKYPPAMADPCAGDKKNIAISQAASAVLVTGKREKIRVCSILIVGADAENISLVEGTGATCGTGTGAVIGGTTAANGPNMPAGGGFQLGNGTGTVAAQNTQGNDLCLLQSGSGRVAGNMMIAATQ
jgi:hypothetical protein